MFYDLINNDVYNSAPGDSTGALGQEGEQEVRYMETSGGGNNSVVVYSDQIK